MNRNSSFPMSNTPQLANLSGYSPDSRIWVYVSSRTLTEVEAATAQEYLSRFCSQWTAHNHSLKAAGEVFQQQFLILMVDETQAGASGCSIDKSVHFLEELGATLHTDFFERMRFGWIAADGVLQMGSAAALAEAVMENNITADTLMVNTLVQTKAELTGKWLVPFANSWHRRLVPAPAVTI